MGPGPEGSREPFQALFRGRSVHGAAAGQGGPPIVLLTGLGVPASSWWALDDGLEAALPSLLHTGAPWGDRPFLGPALAELTRVVSYDRAGMGESTGPAAPRDLEDFLGELEAVLDAANVTEPAVLVGHSLGGLVAFAAARRWPDRVAGVALLDSSHPDQACRLAAQATPQWQQQDAARTQDMAERHPEWPDLGRLLNQGESAVQPGILGDLPMQVVSRGVSACSPQQASSPDMPEAEWLFRTGVWDALQAEYALVSTRGERVRALRSGHYPHFDEPQLVVTAIRRLWEASQS